MAIWLSSKEQDELVTKNLRLVHHLVNKLGVSPSDYDDMVSVGTIGLIKAAVTFDKSKGSKFATYAANCINNEIFMQYRRDKKHLNTSLLDDSIVEDKDGNELTLMDSIMDPESDFEDGIAEREILEKYINIILNLLKPRERTIMLYKMAGVTQPAIAKILKISQSYISRLKEIIKERVKTHFSTLQKFKEVYSMSIVGDSYKISFASKDVMNFNAIFAKFLQDQTSAENLPDFRISCNKERVIIQVPAHPSSFSFIAEILKQIDEYNFTFISDATDMPDKQSISKKVQPEDNENDIPETVIEEKKQIISDNLSTSKEVDKEPLHNTDLKPKRGDKQKMIREYILSKESFTTKELKLQFPNVSSPTIQMVLVEAKEKGEITVVSKGKYATKKD